jgi:hypothetical protein
LRLRFSVKTNPEKDIIEETPEAFAVEESEGLG